jgi:DNA adenine methylase
MPLWEAYRGARLVEPFVGGMAVALGLRPERALLNDTNPHLINFYRWLQRGLVSTLDMRNDGDLYYRHRARFNALARAGEGDSREAAELFYYLNRTGYNGLCRFNRSGEFNVPFGRYRSIPYMRDFSVYAQALGTWEIRCGCYDELEVGTSDFVYADPPYDVEFTQYSAGGFGWEDQVRLAHRLAGLAGRVVASNQATPRILELYEGLGFTIRLLDGPRMISRTGDRTPAKEMLAVRFT